MLFDYPFYSHATRLISNKNQQPTTNNQSHNYLINFNFFNQLELISINHTWSVSPHTMHVDREHFILWYLSIWRFDLGIGHAIATIRISRLFLWYAMNDLMHVMQLWFLGIWNGNFSHLPELNYGCEIECLWNHIGPFRPIAYIHGFTYL